MKESITIIDKDYTQWVDLLIERYQYCHDTIHPQTGGELTNIAIFNVPWGHHKLILDKVKGDVAKALYYVNQVQENNWSRSMLQNWIDTGLYERSEKAKVEGTMPTIEEIEHKLNM